MKAKIARLLKRETARAIGVHHSTVQADLAGGNPPPDADEPSENQHDAQADGGNPPPAPLDVVAGLALLERIARDVAALHEKVDRLDRTRAALDAGRAKAHAQAKRRGKRSAELVLHLAALDVQAGHGSRGRAGRIARTMDGALSEDQVQRILRTLFSVRNSSADTCGVDEREGTHDGL